MKHRSTGAGATGRPRSRAAVCAALLLLLVWSCGYYSTGAPPGRTDVIDSAARALADGYIYEDIGRAMADSLRATLRANGFAQADDAAFAASVRRILARISKDPHLGFELKSAPPQAVVEADSGGSRDEPAIGSGTSRLTPLMPDQGLGAIGFLSPGIAYVEVQGFSGDETALAKMDSAMAAISSANPEALIIDLRDNTGGTPPMVRLISTYMFSQPTHLVTTYMRGMAQPMERWTLDSVAGPRMPSTPVYVLTSRRTFSAAESFIFGLKTKNRITIVGEPTGGGGHFGAFVDLPQGFVMFVPRGRTYDPTTNRGWQAEGIHPDVPARSEEALARALELVRREGQE